MSAVDSVKSPVFRARLLLAAAVALAPAQQGPTLVRLRDAVGDTIDLAERDSFHLFPNTAGFNRAVILAIPGPEFFAEITLADGYTPAQIYFRIMPTQLERIRFLTDNREHMTGQVRSDSNAALALAAFWREIEGRPLRNIAGEPATAQKAPPAPTEVAPPSEPAAEQEVPPTPPAVAPPGEPAVVQEVPPAPPEAAPTGEPQSEPVAVVVRLRDAVGDTIEAAERDSFHLFPNTVGFHHAVILALPGPEFFAEVMRADGDTVRRVYYIILPGQLKRIRFLIDNREYIAAQQRSDSSYAQALASFWQTIEEYALPSTAGEPDDVQHTTPAPADVKPAGSPQLPPVTSENRYNYTLHGATLGSIAGGLIGSSIGIGDAVACGLTVAGSYAGYRYGSGLDRKSVARPPLPWESLGWRTCCTIGASVPALALGAGTVSLVSRGNFTGIPAYMAGLCVVVEVMTLGYRLGRSIDR
jgi:hypothetical protein